MTTGNLTIQDNDTVAQYVAVGESTFVFNWPILAASELKVSKNQVLKTYGADYSITGIGADGGGYITLLAGASTPGDVWTLWQDMPIERLTGFSAGAAAIFGAALNAEFAARLRVEQQLRREIRNSLRIAPDDPVSGQDMVLPPKTSRGGKFLAFDATGKPIVSNGTGGGDAALRTDLASTIAGVDGSRLVGFRHSAAGGAARTLHVWMEDKLSVRDMGADPTGGSDSYAAFASSWAAIKTTGGQLVVPQGTYLLGTQWNLDVDQALPHNYEIIGYGAEIKAAPAVVGHAFRVFKGYNNFGVKIAGFHFNHRGNGTVNGCIQALGAANLDIYKCSVEHHNTKATYAGIELGSHTPGTPDTNSYWSTIRRFTTRMRSGGDGTPAAVGIRLKGAANSTQIKDCSFASVVDSIRFENDGVQAGNANAVLIKENAFESVTNAVTLIVTEFDSYMPTGLRLKDNRLEVATTYVNVVPQVKLAGTFTIGRTYVIKTVGTTNFVAIGAASNTVGLAFVATGAGAGSGDAYIQLFDSGYPPIIKDDYLTVGSVTNFLLNPSLQDFRISADSFFGVAPAETRAGGPQSHRQICDGAGHNFIISDVSGSANYARGHLVIGAYHLWIELATGKLRIKAGAPAADNDGTVVGTQV